MICESAYQDTFLSPIGTILIGASESGIQCITFIEEVNNSQHLIPNHLTVKAQIWLEKYFNGVNPDLDLPLDLEGTEFQKKVWLTLPDIPYAYKATYKQIAQKIPGTSPRAVGNANGLNPILIYLPCHRIVGKDGSLTGYAGGLKRKSWLLTFEANDYLFLPNV